MMQEGALCGPLLICMLLDSLELLVDFAILQVEDPFAHCAH